MSDLFNLSNLGQSDVSGNGPGAGAGGNVNTGDLRRKYNFGDRVSELSISQDPFFRFVSKVGKKPTDDPQFKFTEKRQSFHKRYAYLVNHGSAFATAVSDNADSQDAADDTFYGKFGTDYKNNGNLVNRFGQTIDYAVGDPSTKPLFFMEGQLIKVPVADTEALATAGTTYGYQVVKVTNVADNGQYVNITGKVVKNCASGSFYMGVPSSVAVGASSTTGANEESLAAFKCYVKNEWARTWKTKLVEHKFDIEQSLLFGKQNETYFTTQGAVDYISQYGNLFELNTSTKTADDFLDDMSAYLDPRYNSSSATVYFVSTAVYNWMHKLGGYFKNNLEISTNMRADFAMTGKKKVAGVDITTFSTPYGDMNVARNIHLDGTDIKMLGLNMKYCSYRPLVGNGINRDTSVYVGVQTLENSGIDRRVDLILTEAGMEWCCPETHAVWK